MFSPVDNFMFDIIPVIGCIIFIIVFGMFIYMFVNGARQWKKNNDSPRLSVDAVVVAKRTNVTHHNQENMPSTTSTTYYITFEVESGDRMEFIVQGQEYGMLVEQDLGKLTFQGTRYIGIVRNLD